MSQYFSWASTPWLWDMQLTVKHKSVLMVLLMIVSALKSRLPRSHDRTSTQGSTSQQVWEKYDRLREVCHYALETGVIINGIWLLFFSSPLTTGLCTIKLTLRMFSGGTASLNSKARTSVKIRAFILTRLSVLHIKKSESKGTYSTKAKR